MKMIWAWMWIMDLVIGNALTSDLSISDFAQYLVRGF